MCIIAARLFYAAFETVLQQVQRTGIVPLAHRRYDLGLGTWGIHPVIETSCRPVLQVAYADLNTCVNHGLISFSYYIHLHDTSHSKTNIRISAAFDGLVSSSYILPFLLFLLSIVFVVLCYLDEDRWSGPWLYLYIS